MSEETNNRQVRRIILISVITVIIAAVLIVVLTVTGVINLPSFGKNEVNEDAENGNEPEQFDEIKNQNGSEYTIFTPEEKEDPFVLVTEHESYTREFRIVSISGSEYSVEKYTLVKKDSLFRAETDSKTLISDGNRLYIVYPNDFLITSVTEDSMYSETGITSLDSIKSRTETSEYITELLDNGKNIMITFAEDENGFLDEYKISVETGIVLEENSYLNGFRYRSVVTDSFDVFAANDIEDDVFAIPSEQ